jgi:choice-of-anchor B domain-containing protein
MKAVSIVFLSLLSLMAFGQANYNINLVGTLPYTQDCNDIWSWQHPTTNVEYAIVGARNGTSLVSLATPSAPSQVQYIPGASSTWRDIKTYGDYAYVTCDQGQDGLLIIDLSNLPNSVNFNFWRPELTINGVTDTFNKAHNIYIDENGIAYIAGSNINNGEPFFLDLNPNPWLPTLVGYTPPTYAHDVYARGDTLWTSDIYDGAFSGYDITDKSNPVYLGGATTPDFFTHNTWISDDGNSLFTTDERPNAYIGSYDVSDMNNVTELDRWRPFETEGTGVIPHNVHVLNDFIVISYYTDGLIVLDGSRPDNLVEVGRYDTYLPNNTGFDGCWGATPYLSSGLIIASDINSGLYVFQPSYQRACWLEGNVTDTLTATPLFDVLVEIVNTPVYENSVLSGDYKTGYGISGTYDVTFSKSGYFPKTVSVTLVNGQVSIQDVELMPMTPFTFSGQVVDADNANAPIPNAVVYMESPNYDYSTTTDASGNFTIPSMFADNYEIYAGKWGYKTVQLTQNLNAGTASSTIPLNQGYRDEFALDLGWTTSATASAGLWARAESEEISFFGATLTPDLDLPGDIGTQCYISGDQNNGSAGADDIDNGDIILTSPTFDLSAYNDPYVSYYAWFANLGGSGNPNDSMVVTLSNGTTSAVIAVYDSSTYAWTPIQNFRVSDFLTPTANMQIEFLAFDRSPGHLVEVAVDLFEVADSGSVSTNLVALEQETTISAMPNPSVNSFNIDLSTISQTKTQLRVFNSLGQLVETHNVRPNQHNIQLGSDWTSGVYFIEVAGQNLKLVKQE